MFSPIRRYLPLAMSLATLLACHSELVRVASKAASEVAHSEITWSSDLPVYDHIVIVVEENKNYGQIIGSPNAPYINEVLRREGANLTRMFAEEHFSEGNYFWLFSGSNQNVGYLDRIPAAAIDADNLGHELISSGHSFAGFSEGLPTVSSTVAAAGHYARKHVPWVSFSNLPHGASKAESSNLRFPEDFPTDYQNLPTVSFVIPNMIHDMHDGSLPESIQSADAWLRKNIDPYYQWAKNHNSLLILTFDEDAHGRYPGGLTDPASLNPRIANRIPTILAGGRVQHGDFDEGKGVNHVSILRTLEAMYRVKRTGKQQRFAQQAGIGDDLVLVDVFEKASR